MKKLLLLVALLSGCQSAELHESSFAHAHPDHFCTPSCPFYHEETFEERWQKAADRVFHSR